MSTYKDRAVLLLEDGRKFDVDADLAKDASGTWQGTLTPHDRSLSTTLLNVDDGHVIIDGRTGEFIRPDRSDWTVSRGGPFTMRILGSGEAPF